MLLQSPHHELGSARLAAQTSSCGCIPLGFSVSYILHKYCLAILLVYSTGMCPASLARLFIVSRLQYFSISISISISILGPHMVVCSDLLHVPQWLLALPLAVLVALGLKGVYSSFGTCCSSPPNNAPARTPFPLCGAGLCDPGVCTAHCCTVSGSSWSGSGIAGSASS